MQVVTKAYRCSWDAERFWSRLRDMWLRAATDGDPTRWGGGPPVIGGKSEGRGLDRESLLLYWSAKRGLAYLDAEMTPFTATTIDGVLKAKVAGYLAEAKLNAIETGGRTKSAVPQIRRRYGLSYDEAGELIEAAKEWLYYFCNQGTVDVPVEIPL